MTTGIHKKPNEILKCYQSKRLIFCDIETESLTPKLIHCLVAKVEGEVFSFFGKSAKDAFKAFFEKEKDSYWVFHNGLSFDIPTISNLYNVTIPLEKTVDTLTLSKLLRPKRPYGHSLEQWGIFLGFNKIAFKDFQVFSMEMLTYCIRDVEVTEKLFWHLVKDEAEGFSLYSFCLEQEVRTLMDLQQKNGFYLDQGLAGSILAQTGYRMIEIEEEVKKVFKPVFKPLKKQDEGIVKVRYKKDGSLSSVGIKQYEHVWGDFCPVFAETFNLGSVVQIKERLFKMGWQPTKFKKPTKKQALGGAKKGAAVVDEETMSAFAEKSGLKEIKLLAEYLLVRSRHSTVEQWLTLCDNKSRIHGRVDTLGAATARMTHSNPNSANIPSVPKNKEGVIKGLAGGFGFECRSCWTVEDPSRQVIVGADASGIQLRALAHYMGDEDYIKEICEGDVHTRHQIAAGLPTRDSAKTFIYAWLLGAGDAKIGQIIGKGAKEGAALKEKFLNSFPALKELKVRISVASQRGFMYGLDGRKLWIPSEHLAMSLYLQGFEAVIMKKAMVDYQRELRALKVPFKQVAMVHDEFQIETLKEYGETVGKTVVKAIENAGKVLRSKCPLTGEFGVGSSWAFSH